MEPRKPSRLPQNPIIPQSEPLEDPKVAGEEEQECKEIEEEIEEDGTEVDEDEEEDSEATEDEEVEESEEETEVEEREDDVPKNSSSQPSRVRKNHIIRKQSNLLQSDPKRKEEKERGKSYSPRSPSPSSFIIRPRPITHKRLRPEYSGDDEKDSTDRKKTKTKDQQEKEHKSLPTCPGSVPVGRVWCQEDEIAILEGMLEYRNKEGAYPPSNMFSFHEFIRWKLYSDISRIQLCNKVKRLRRKFFLTLKKTDNSVNPTLPKPDDYVVFDLSRKIWTRSDMVNPYHTDTKAKEKNSKLRKASKKGCNKDSVVKKDYVLETEHGAMGDLKAEDENLELKYPYLSESLWRESSSLGYADSVKGIVLKEKLSLIGQAKAEELDNEWKKLREQEAEILLKKMYLIAEQTKLMLTNKKNM